MSGVLCGGQQISGPRPGVASSTLPPSRPLLVGYFPQWGVYQGYYVRNLVQSGGAGLLDQINYAQGFVTGGRCSVADPNADLNLAFTAANSADGTADDPALPFRGNFHQLAELKRRYPKLKILISLEGRAADFAQDAQPAAREAFVRSCVDTFLRGHFLPGVEQAAGAPPIFDGIDVDWEYPHGDDAENFLQMLALFRREMDRVRPGLRLSVAVGVSPHMYAGVDTGRMAALVDQVGLMNYDYNGPWSRTTGFLAPLYSPAVDASQTAAAAATGGEEGSVARSVTAWVAAGVPPQELLLGLPFYGYGWREVDNAGHGLFQSGRPIRGDRPYNFLAALMSDGHDDEDEPDPGQAPPKPFTVYRDPQSKAPWMFNGETFWTYEDPVSVAAKIEFAREQNLGGAMLWELSGDTESATLLKTARRGLDTSTSVQAAVPQAEQKSEQASAPAN